MHHLRPAPGAKKDRVRKGRGEASKGKTSGRGGKGTHARNTVRIGFEGGQMPLHMRLPKLKGFKNPERVEYQAVNVATLNELFPKGGAVTVAQLIEYGAVRKGLPVKVLGNGEISVPITISVQGFSTTAEEKIKAAGGKITKVTKL